MTATRAMELAAKLEAAGGEDVHVTVDPRSATPPCLLLDPPDVRWDGNCSGTADWRLWALAPNPFNLDAWMELDRLLSVAFRVVPVERHYGRRWYSLSQDTQPVPAYLITFTEGVDNP